MTEVYKYTLGPFATESGYYNFCIQHGIPMEQKEFPRYGIFWGANLTEEDAIAFKLRFTKSRFIDECEGAADEV